MVVTFNSYDELLASGHTEGDSYEIIVNDPDSDVCIVAPHAGKIEEGTSEISKAIAKDDFRLYLFEGCLSKRNYKKLHITSHKFDEPRALRLVGKSRIVLGVHGMEDRGDKTPIYLGGRDEEFVNFIASQLKSFGFESTKDERLFTAIKVKNICNRGSSGMGAQIEVPRTLRDRFRGDAKLLASFSVAIRNSIKDKLNV